MLAQPSGSWKLRAMSIPFCSVHTMSVSTRRWSVLGESRWRCARARTLLLLVAVVLGDARLEQLALLVVFGGDDNAGVFGLGVHTLVELGAVVAVTQATGPVWAMRPRRAESHVHYGSRPCRSRCPGQTSHCS